MQWELATLDLHLCLKKKKKKLWWTVGLEPAMKRGLTRRLRFLLPQSLGTLVNLHFMDNFRVLISKES